MKFKQRPREEQAEPDETEEANYAAENFALTKPRVRVGSEWVSKGQNLDQVNWAIGAMSKALYARVFEWLVKKCNLTLDQKGLSRDSFIGVLDIAGFEIFDFNSFEQLWINFVNEKLQQFFNHHMFVLEQEEYAREGIAWTFIDFGLDLQACIELIEKPMGIISMLDEECIVPKASDLTYAQKLGDQHLGKHPNFEKPKPPKGKQGEAHFAMRHYAGTVRYNVTNWLEKNKDPLNDTLVSVMKNAKGNQLIIDIWADYQTQEEAAEANKKGGGGKKKGKSGSFMTVSMLYRESLNNLMNMLHKTHPHFIRCIIPNEKKQSGMIDAALVLNQLTCNGVLEGIRICRKGFPNRLPHNDFKVRYGILAAAEARSSTDPKVSSANILEKLVNAKSLEAENFKVGHTKVFFKAGVLAHIEELRDKCMNDLMCMFQSACRAYLAKMGAARRRKQLDAYSIVQRNIRSWCVLRTWEWYLLYGRVKPLCKGDKHAEELEKMEADLKASEEILAKQEEQRKAIEAEHNRLAEERRKLQEQLEIARKGGSAVESEMGALNAQKTELERRLEDAKDKLNEQQQKAEDNQRSLKRAEKDKESLNDQIETLNETLNRVEEEKLQEQLEEFKRQKSEAESKQQIVEQNIVELNIKLDEQNTLVSKLQRYLKDQSTRLVELEEELEQERVNRSRSDKNRGTVQTHLDELSDFIDEEAGKAAAQAELAKKKDLELIRLRQELEEINQQSEQQLSLIRKRNNDEISEATERLENLQNARGKTEKDKETLRRQIEDIQSQQQDEQRQRNEYERQSKNLGNFIK
uniref:Myosin motor domain-containing protein n=1 Tax=Meloidogyne javanica TaxID=6303 RepID=A0A915LC96_MELJA